MKVIFLWASPKSTRIAAKSGGWVYYLGGLAEGQDPYDMLKPLVNAISGFSLKHS